MGQASARALCLFAILGIGNAALAAEPNSSSAPAPVAAAAPSSAPAAAKAALPAIEKVELGAGGGLVVNGKPFFPLMGFYQSPKSFKNAPAIGLNGEFFPGDDPAPKAYLDALKAEGLYGMVPFDANAAAHPACLAWLLPHEPDGAYLAGKAEMSPAAMLAAYEKIKKADPSRPVVLDLSPAFTSIPEESNLPADRKKEIYPAYAKAADILTYNVYPIWGFNKPECLDWPARAADDLRSLMGPQARKPFFAMIETGKGAPTVPVEEQKDVSADEIRAEAWMAICHGATGIIYFTHQFKPKFNEFGPDAAKQAAIKKINDQIAELAPIFLSPPGKEQVFPPPTMEVDGNYPTGAHLHMMTRMNKGSYYLFVLNGGNNRRAKDVTIAIEDENVDKEAPVEVLGENRKLAIKKGEFTDEFEPLALHVYKLAGPRAEPASK